MVLNGWIGKKFGVRVSATVGNVCVVSVVTRTSSETSSSDISPHVQLVDAPHLLVTAVGLRRRAAYDRLALRHRLQLLLRLGVDCCQPGRTPAAIAAGSQLHDSAQWLPHRVGLASGIMVGGYGCGSFIFSPIETLYVNPSNELPDADG